MEYNFKKIEKEWQEKWKATHAYKVSNNSSKPKYYVLDMFPYPSGAGLHVGHPLGYIASDIYSRYKRLKGYNVLHPMGYDSFGLPAEQYALETGQHPAVTTEKNIATFRSQLDKIGFCYDWDREVRTSDPNYYRWTQWIFLQLFNSWYNRSTQKAEPIDTLIAIFEKEGNESVNRRPTTDNRFTADEWKNFDEKTKQDILMQYRLAYSAYGEVNWCEALGTVLANDEVVNGVSERGGHPVVKKKMRQWYLRITEYADRLLEGLEHIEFSDAMKEMQRNWIGKSQGAELEFGIRGLEFRVKVYTTRPDTIFGVDFLVLAPEHELVSKITTSEQKEEIEKYLAYVKSRSERERLSEVKQITGCFTGAYAINPFSGKEVPVWIAEYVLAGYGTGAIMAVPCGDQRDFTFAKHFGIAITNIIGEHFNGEEANPTKEAILHNSGFLDGMPMKDAMEVAIAKMEALGIGKRQVNYKMRDAGFSRQRYWGEPFPIIWKDGIAYPLDEKDLPLELPHVDKYGPGPEGEGPLANLKEWVLTPCPSPQMEKGVNKVPKYKVSSPMQYELAKNMRKGHTEAEAALWEVLRNNTTGEKFRRQHPIDTYIVDFVCLQKRLIVEVDGNYHENVEQKMYDENRTSILNEIGFEVIRFSNEEVLQNPLEIKKKIEKYLTEANKAPSPFMERGRGVRETSTMPGYAGSSWYFLRYMDPHNNETFCDKKASDYWNRVDVYIGGTEHAVGHLLYSRMWTKFLYDLGYISFDEPFKKLVNQGMIQGSSRFVYRLQFPNLLDALKGRPNSGETIFISKGIYDKLTSIGIQNPIAIINYLKEQFADSVIVQRAKNTVTLASLHADVNIVDGIELDIKKFRESKPEYREAIFILEDGSINTPLSTCGEGQEGRYICGVEVEKMSKSKFNTVNPNDLVEKYGADTFRMYEMFLGPIEMSKPWDTKGIEGVHRFLRKLWRLFFDEVKGKVWNEEKPTDAELKILHRTIKKIEEDTERFSFNTAVSTFMIAVNELTDAKCHKKEVLEKILILLTPYAPHIAEELWHQLGNEGSVLDAAYPKLEEKYLVETSKEYPISINGKVRTNINLPLDLPQSEVETLVLKNDVVQKWIEGKQPKKIIFVKGKMVNVVV